MYDFYRWSVTPTSARRTGRPPAPPWPCSPSPATCLRAGAAQTQVRTCQHWNWIWKSLFSLVLLMLIILTPYLLFCWSIPAIHFSHSIYCLSFQNWGIFISPPQSLYCVKWFCVSKKTPAGSILHTHTAAAEERRRQHFISSPFTFHAMPESHNKAEVSTSNVYRYPHQAIFRIFSKKNDFHDSPHCPELNDKLLEASPECDILNLALRNNSP